MSNLSPEKKEDQTIKTDFNYSFEDASNNAFTLAEEAQSVEDYEKACDLLIYSGRGFRILGDAFKALSTLNRAFNLINLYLPSDKSKLAHVYRELGNVYANSLKDFETSLDYCFKGYKLNVPKLNVIFLNNIGSNYIKLGNFEEAKAYLSRGIKAQKPVYDNVSISYIYSNFGEIYYEEKNYEKALEEFKRSINICYEFYNQLDDIAEIKALQYIELQCFLNKARTYAALNDHKSSIECLSYTKTKSVEYGLPEAESISYLEEGRILCTRNKYAELRALYKIGIHFSENHQYYFDKHDWYELMLSVEESEGNFEEGLSISKLILENQMKIISKHKEVNISNLLVMKEEQILELENRNRIMQRQKQELEQFANIIAHDLKTPISNISNFAGLFGMKYKDSLDETGEEYLSFIESNSKLLYEMLNGLMDYISTDQGELGNFSCDVNYVIHKIIQKNNFESRKDIDLDIISDSQFPMHEIHLESILDNLISNAIKFSTKNQIAKIQIKHQIIDENHLITVMDNGVGIEDAYKLQIFEIFRRLNKIEFKGTGVGLAICKKIIQKYSGNIWVEDAPSGGSSFHFKIPNLYHD